MQKIMFNDKYCLTELTLLGSKTMTRRIVPEKLYEEWKRLENPSSFEEYAIQNSHFKIDEIIAVAMSYKDILELMIEKKDGYGEEESAFEEKYTKTKGWNNKMFVKADEMLCHIQITGMRCERLQDIPEEECLKEGIMLYGNPFHEDEDRIESYSYLGGKEHFATAKEAFASLIDHVSKKGTWESNPYVIAYSFKVVKYQKPQMLIEEEFNKAIAREIDNEIFMSTWYLGHPVDSKEYKLMLEEKEAYARMNEANPHIEAQRMEYINSMDDVTSEHFTGAEIRALKAYFEASEKYDEVRERYVRTFEEAKNKMIDCDKIIELIRRNGDFQYNEKDSSYYLLYKTNENETIEVRVSDHETDLSTWYNGNQDTSTATNICIVFSEDVNSITNENVSDNQKPFEVIQYVYNYKLLDKTDVAYINQAIHFIWGTKQFNDPMVGTSKEAKVVKLANS